MILFSEAICTFSRISRPPMASGWGPHAVSSAGQTLADQQEALIGPRVHRVRIDQRRAVGLRILRRGIGRSRIRGRRTRGLGRNGQGSQNCEKQGHHVTSGTETIGAGTMGGHLAMNTPMVVQAGLGCKSACLAPFQSASTGDDGPVARGFEVILGPRHVSIKASVPPVKAMSATLNIPVRTGPMPRFGNTAKFRKCQSCQSASISRLAHSSL